MPGNGELNNFYECKRIPTTIKEVKIFIENFLIKLNNTLKNEYKETFSEYEKIFSEYKEILGYLQDIRKNLNNQQKSGVEAKTSEEISKTLISENILKEGSFEENLKEIENLIEKWIIFKRYIDSWETDSKNVNKIKELLNTIQRMFLTIGNNQTS